MRDRPSSNFFRQRDPLPSFSWWAVGGGMYVGLIHPLNRLQRDCFEPYFRLYYEVFMLVSYPILSLPHLKYFSEVDQLASYSQE